MGMLDISKKEITEREAIVEGKIYLKPETIKSIRNKKIPKGDVLEAARIAGMLAAKKTPDVIPLCHPIPIEYIGIDFTLGKDHINLKTTVKGQTKTGVEMEAFIATAISALTIYDMCKALDRGITVSDIRLLKKTGGKSGTYIRKIRNPKSPPAAKQYGRAGEIRNKSK